MFELPHAESQPIHAGAQGNAATPRPAPAAAPRRIDSAQLLAGTNELLIRHADQEYRLRLTRNDKLILTK